MPVFVEYLSEKNYRILKTIPMAVKMTMAKPKPKP